MRAYVHHRYGGPEVLELADVPRPEPKPDELLVQVHATTVTAGDWRGLTLAMPPGFGPMGRLVFGLRSPRQPILGQEMAGVVAAVGSRVTRFRPGDEVFASTGARMGCHAEFVTVREGGHVARRPARLSMDEAAALSFGGSTAVHFLRAGKVARGERVLVIGASGGVGTAVVQLATHMGASVTGVASAGNAELVASLGAERVIDYAKEDALAGTYDVIVDTVGETSFARAKGSLAEGGRLLAVATDLRGMLAAPFVRGSRKVVAGVAPTSAAMARDLAALAEEGALRPFIGHRFPFEQLPEAHALVASRRKRGNVVVRVAPGA